VQLIFHGPSIPDLQFLAVYPPGFRSPNTILKIEALGGAAERCSDVRIGDAIFSR